MVAIKVGQSFSPYLSNFTQTKSLITRVEKVIVKARSIMHLIKKCSVAEIYLLLLNVIHCIRDAVDVYEYVYKTPNL